LKVTLANHNFFGLSGVNKHGRILHYANCVNINQSSVLVLDDQLDVNK
jgi:hypothetical protein